MIYDFVGLGFCEWSIRMLCDEVDIVEQYIYPSPQLLFFGPGSLCRLMTVLLGPHHRLTEIAAGTTL